MSAVNRQNYTIPIEDQHTSLNILLEFALQRGALSGVLEMVLLMLSLWDKRVHQLDNRYFIEQSLIKLIKFTALFLQSIGGTCLRSTASISTSFF